MNFINCTNHGDDDFIHISDSVQFDGCLFKDNDAVYEFITSISNSKTAVFKNSIFIGGTFKQGVILADRVNLIVENCTFENLSSNLGTAINYKGWNLTVRNSKFLNLNAELSGGAILAKFFPNNNGIGDSFLIEDCEFTNATSSNDGGAIYYDLDSGSNFTVKTLNVISTDFNGCKSKYGGAIADLGGVLNIVNSTFEENYAGFEGGAIYTSWCAVNMKNTTLSSNKDLKDDFDI